MSPDLAWIVESSRDGEKWRTMGTAWTQPGESLLVHGASRFLRFRPADAGGGAWSDPLERTGGACMALLDLDAGTRIELWPEAEHIGLPVFLPGGEAGRLLSFERAGDGYGWTYTLEFRGETPERFRA